MMKRLPLAESALWLFAIIFSLQIGAGLYEACVVTPLWSQALPASVREFISRRKICDQAARKFLAFLHACGRRVRFRCAAMRRMFIGRAASPLDSGSNVTDAFDGAFHLSLLRARLG